MSALEAGGSGSSLSTPPGKPDVCSRDQTRSIAWRESSERGDEDFFLSPNASREVT